ncbi:MULTISPECIES: hypothetical protein [Rhodococcus]|uniref:Uncharacterized protein n=1 Tax=Rhodococcus qingshengii JCM 15477 TaxID=1303681 RepID=A0AB38RNQ7_RHOSG|nr:MULTISPECIES: hypothetical protein [Rhodococcus]MDA3635264.1 hypothetical protein [Rhodococcus sp. C-2]UPU46827.1 hypothetical protein M0639_32065 [Rhodococcus qingshengii JCM 15477]
MDINHVILNTLGCKQIHFSLNAPLCENADSVGVLGEDVGEVAVGFFESVGEVRATQECCGGVEMPRNAQEQAEGRERGRRGRLR